MQTNHVHQPDPVYDPDLPNASAVLSALSCVSAQYVISPSYELARLALSLASKLAAPQYAESKLIPQIASQLRYQWDVILKEQVKSLAMTMSATDTTH